MIKVNGKEVEFKQFPNGETFVDHKSIAPITGEHTTVDFKYADDSDLVKLMFVKRYLDDHVEIKHSLFLNIWYMPYSRMDRSENGSVFTLQYTSEFINWLGFDVVNVIEPHSEVTEELVKNIYADYINFDLIHDALHEVSFDLDNDYVVFPDKGAQQRYSELNIANTLTAEKVRDFETGEITSLEINEEVSGSANKALVVDDLSSYGGTFVKTAEELRKLGFDEVYLLVAHAENAIFKGQVFDHYDKVFTTNSILTEHEEPQNSGNPQLKVYNLEDVLR